MFEWITGGVALLFLIVGLIGLLSKRGKALLKQIPVGTPELWAIILVAVGLGFGGVAYATSFVAPASLTAGDQADADVLSATGNVALILSDGLSNATATEDYLNDAEDVMSIYSADANIADGEDYAFNITIDRQLIAEDANVVLTCSAPDKEISGVDDDNLIDKDAGKIDLTFVGGSSTRYDDDNTVYTSVAFAEGENSKEIQVVAEQVEAYHDGMADFDDSFEIVCEAQGETVEVVIYADN